MNSREILRHLETSIMEDIGYHLMIPDGRLEHYHFAGQIRDIESHDSARWIDLLVQLQHLILNMKPFCMRAPPELANMEGADTALGNLIRVSRIYNIMRACQEIHVDFQGRVFNEP